MADAKGQTQISCSICVNAPATGAAVYFGRCSCAPLTFDNDGEILISSSAEQFCPAMLTVFSPSCAFIHPSEVAFCAFVTLGGANYAGGDIDKINLANGSVFVRIPIYSLPQRGNKLHFGFSLQYNNTGVCWRSVGSVVGTLFLCVRSRMISLTLSNCR